MLLTLPPILLKHQWNLIWLCFTLTKTKLNHAYLRNVPWEKKLLIGTKNDPNWLQLCSKLKRKAFLNQNVFITFPLWGLFRMLFGDPNERKLGYNITHYGYTYYSNLGSEYAQFGWDNIPRIAYISHILGILNALIWNSQHTHFGFHSTSKLGNNFIHFRIIQNFNLSHVIHP